MKRVGEVVVEYDEGKRIYVVLAETVLNPLWDVSENGEPVSVTTTPETAAIVQPKGRLGAQAFHLGRRLGYWMAKVEMDEWWDRLSKREVKAEDGVDWKPYTDYTTIVLAARDSLELFHVYYLLSRKGFAVHKFEDENEEYGNGKVVTGFCVEPVEPQ